MRIIIIICLLLFCAGCNVPSQESSPTGEDVRFSTDGNSQNAKMQPKRVLALSSSIAEIWLLGGGELAGVTSDALEGRNLGLEADIEVLGTVKDPNLERILALEPDLVLLSQDISSHMVIADTLEQANIEHYVSKVETLEEYLKVLEDFSRITGDTKSFEQNGENVRQEVQGLLARLDKEELKPPITALFLRAYSSGVKVKASEHTVCTILEDIGVENIGLRSGFPLEELSIESIVEADPDYIFVVPMGDEGAATTELQASLLSNQAFKSLRAVEMDNLIMLPKDLYHYKPNNRWGEAYETLLKIVYPQIFGDN